MPLTVHPVAALVLEPQISKPILLEIWLLNVQAVSFDGPGSILGHSLWISGRQSDTDTVLFPIVSCFLGQYHCTNAPCLIPFMYDWRCVFLTTGSLFITLFSLFCPSKFQSHVLNLVSFP